MGEYAKHAGENVRRTARFSPINRHQNVLDDLLITNNAKEGTAKLNYTHNSEGLKGIPSIHEYRNAELLGSIIETLKLNN